VIGGAVAIAVALLVSALPAFEQFAVRAPVEFWITTALALVVDIPLFGTGRRNEARVRPTATPGLTLAILLLWGPAPAFVVQAAAGTVSAIGQRQSATGRAFLVARLICALAAADFAQGLTSHVPITGNGTDLTAEDIGPFIALAAAWLVVNFGLPLLVAGAVWSRGLHRATAAVRGELLRSIALVLLVAPLVTMFTGWWDVLVALPMLAWNERTRDYLRNEERSHREPATGLLNREGLEERLQALTLYDPLRPEHPQPIGVVFVNVDSVLTIGGRLGWDTYGKVVQECGRRLAGAFGPDRAGRLTGEGFVVLVSGLTEPDAVAEASRVAQVLRPVIVVDAIPFDIDPAAGVALSPEHGRDLETLVLRAQRAAGEVRRAVKPAGVYVKQSQDIADRRVAILAELHAALLDASRHQEIGVVYQPQVELSTGRLAGAEALLRWSHPDWGPVAPDELIDAVEPSEVMRQLTRHMLNRTGAQLRAWQERGLSLRVAVNVSMQDLHDPAFPSRVSDVVREYNIPPDRLTIEITERLLLGDTERVAHAAREITRLGVGLSLDDFGTGYASIQQLRLLPLTEVKIDKSYASGLADDAVKRAIVGSVHELASALGLSVVAEGVEDEATTAILTQLPGIIAQGWHFGRPVPAEDFHTRWGHHPRREP